MQLKIGNLIYDCDDYTEEMFLDKVFDEPRKYWSFYLINNSDKIINIEEIQNILSENENTIIIVNRGEKIVKFDTLYFCYFDQINNILIFKTNI